MKPERLSVDPNTSTAAEQWKHWRKTFDNYILSFPEAERTAMNNLQVLVNCLAYEI